MQVILRAHVSASDKETVNKIRGLDCVFNILPIGGQTYHIVVGRIGQAEETIRREVRKVAPQVALHLTYE